MRRSDKMLMERIRFILSQRKSFFSERKMFGSVCFMLNGKIFVGTWKGSLLVRVGKEQYDKTLEEPHTKPADMSGQVMRGWVIVEPEGIEYEDDLKIWINRAVRFTSSLPSK